MGGLWWSPMLSNPKRIQQSCSFQVVVIRNRRGLSGFRLGSFSSSFSCSFSRFILARKWSTPPRFNGKYLDISFIMIICIIYVSYHNQWIWMDFRYITGICCIYTLFLGICNYLLVYWKETGFRLMQPLQTPPAFLFVTSFTCRVAICGKYTYRIHVIHFST